MKIPTLLKLCQRNLATASKPHLRQDAGFNMVELVIGMLVIAILSSIAAPGWLAFINNQRLRTSQSSVSGALQLAQSFAKRDKIAWQASFRMQGNLVQWAIHPATTDPTTLPVSTSNSSAPNVWYSLQDNISISTSGTGSTNVNPVSGIYRAIFNRQGCIVDKADAECTDTPTAAGFSPLQRITLQHSQLGPARKCALVMVPLGAIKTAEDAATCDLNP
ncbi:prepilin-type N-terminal cleavage/methylation domain-containing protein [Oscillatoriales cyanobacterium USR001]|nr:prepilin-type N-terminal cleavage/methylation domain-containing protein [Oscillatoriales cyanobacterium USR001]